jgi:uncharacterized protein (DUF58 family)
VTVPTNRALWVFAALSPLAIAGYFTPIALAVLAILDVVLVLLVWLDTRLAIPPGRMEVERVSPVGFSVGRMSTVSYTWRNGTPRSGKMRIRELRPSILGGVQPVRTVTVRGGETIHESSVVNATRRGRENAGWFAVRSEGPLGLAQRQGRIDLPWDVTVFPAIASSRLKASLAEAMRRREAGLRATRRPGEGRIFESLREWVPGDDTRHIDWKASARRRKLITRQYEEERRQQVLLVLDAGRLLTAEIGGVARFEYAVKAALALAFAAHRHADNVGVMVFADTVKHYVTAQRGQRGLRQVLEVLAVAEPTLVEPDYPGAFRYLAIRNRKRALTVLFSDVIDRSASSALVANAASLVPRHLPLVVTLRNPELDSIVAGHAETAHDAYRKAAAAELLASREDALAVMRRAGAVVLDVPPEQAGVMAVEKYVELKQRGRL